MREPLELSADWPLFSRRLAALFFSFPVWFSLSAVGLPPIAQLAAYVAYFVLVYLGTT